MEFARKILPSHSFLNMQPPHYSYELLEYRQIAVEDPFSKGMLNLDSHPNPFLTKSSLVDLRKGGCGKGIFLETIKDVFNRFVQFLRHYLFNLIKGAGAAWITDIEKLQPKKTAELWTANKQSLSDPDPESSQFIQAVCDPLFPAYRRAFS